eukprot:CAMPEP_0194169094 /NCGR_PEP_ID=MMETSP0154-20130528/3789_1 /TAXON_ID=1049557 /ORGANISM="Thalassiothrix antarctica, Strain L6-D1" /LENGTH=335 /DNA_ID=CAMNT_0038880337 /DNA_START=30 /DNA_END=1037 /DNA_ORIENTATION=+
MAQLFTFCLVILSTIATGFTVPLTRSINKFGLKEGAGIDKKKPRHHHDFSSSAIKTRGGGLYSVNISAIKSAMEAGPLGVLALTGIACSVVVPLTMYRQGYSFSVGYGFSVFAMALALTKTFQIGLFNLTPLSLLATAVMFYGARLGAYLLVRNLTVPSKAETMKKLDKSPRLQRIPLAIAVSMFYAFITSPLMYAARYSVANSLVMNVGVSLAWLGALMEAIADAQKYLVKRSAAKETDTTFVGPTGGVYRICRHPNYFAEVIYWFGVALAGVPSFGKSPIAWGCSLLGFYGIFGVMTSASKRLDEKQKEMYGGQSDYDNYKNDVTGAIWPWAR